MKDIKFRGTKNTIILLIVATIWAGLLHCLIVERDFTEKHPITNIAERFLPSQPDVTRTLRIEPDYYLLRINHAPQTPSGKSVVLNQTIIAPFKTRMRKNRTEESNYYRIEPRHIQKPTTLKIDLSSDFSRELKISLKNYRNLAANGNIAILLRSPKTSLLRIDSTRAIAIFIAAYIFLGAATFLLNDRFRHMAQDIMLIVNAVCTVIAVANAIPFVPYVIVIKASYVIFWLVSIASLITAMQTISLAARFLIARGKIKPAEFQRTKKVTILIIATLITPMIMLYGMATRPGLFPVEIFDESTHTYTEIPIAQKALLRGHIQKMNFFNNFGTPLIGDPIANTYAIHTLPYFFCKPHIAMIINKMAFWIFTFLALFKFYRKRDLSFYAALLTALLTLTAPAFYWFIQHHPHQGVLCFFLCTILCIEWASEKPTLLNHILLHVCFVIYLLSSGVIGIFLGIPFVLGFTLILAKCDLRKVARLFLLPLLSALVLTHPHFLYFLKISSLTWRSGFTWESVNPYSFTDLLRGCAIQTTTCDYHTDWSINFSLMTIVFAFLGLAVLKNDGKSRNSRLTLILGFAPFIIVIIMLRFRELQSALPLIYTIDMTRVLWFATVFLMIPLGLIFDKITRAQLPLNKAKNLLYPLAILLAIAAYILRDSFDFVELAIYVFLPVLIIITYCILIKLELRQKKAFRTFAIVLFLSFLFPRYNPYERITNGLYVSEKMTVYSPVEFARRMEPFNRLATGQLPLSLDPSSSADQKIAKHNILGSGGRSIITNRRLRKFLEENHEIAYGEGWKSLLYRFEPAPPQKLAPLAIRYFVVETKDAPALERLGWKEIQRVNDISYKNRGLFTTTPQDPNEPPNALALFENPLKPTPFYYEKHKKIEFLRNYKFQHDSIEIDLTAIDDEKTEITAAFVAWPGWKAYLDGKTAKITAKQDNLIRVEAANAQKLKLTFEPFSNTYILTAAAISIIFIALSTRLTTPKNSATAKNPLD